MSSMHHVVSMQYMHIHSASISCSAHLIGRLVNLSVNPHLWDFAMSLLSSLQLAFLCCFLVIKRPVGVLSWFQTEEADTSSICTQYYNEQMQILQA